jgi:hypothetical protein
MKLYIDITKAGGDGMTPCKSTFVNKAGVKLRCEHALGHDSVHYNGDVWWPNKKGLPNHRRGLMDKELLVWLLLGLFVLGAVVLIIWLS